MKTLKTTFAALALCGLAACTAPAPESVAGFIADATMNTVTLRALTSEQTYTFATAEADKSKAYGLLVGSPAIVEYTGDLKKNPEAVKISADRTYAEAVGRWTVPDPSIAAKVMGVELQTEGRAQSINMATLIYTGWELQGEAGKILLKGQSIGNGQTIGFTETGVISKDAAGRYTLSIEGTGTVYTKAQ